MAIIRQKSRESSMDNLNLMPVPRVRKPRLTAAQLSLFQES